MGWDRRGGCGAMLFMGDGSGRKFSMRQSLGEQCTNNIAEWRGLLLGIQLGARKGIRHLSVSSDSQLIVNQMNGHWKIKKAYLMELCVACRRAVKRAGISLTLTWRPRRFVAAADKLAKLAANEN